MKDTFWTIGYKGCWIHGHRDRDLGKEVIRIQTPDYKTYEAKSLLSAKIKITRFINAQPQS